MFQKMDEEWSENLKTNVLKWTFLLIVGPVTIILKRNVLEPRGGAETTEIKFKEEYTTVFGLIFLFLLFLVNTCWLVAGIFIILGSLLTMIGGIGVIRFGDLMSRVHAAAKAPTLGLLLIALGAAIEIGSADAFAVLGLVVVLQLLTSPVATHVLARASYGQVDFALDGEDDLADYYASIDGPDDPDDV